MRSRTPLMTTLLGKGLCMALFPICLFLAVPAAFADWSAFLGDPSRTSYAAKVPNPPLSLKWKFKAGGPVNSSPALSGGKVFFGSSDKNLYALDSSTGKLLWSFKTGGEIVSSPAVSGNKVFFGSADGKVYALDASSGKLLWSHETQGPVFSSPLVADGAVYIGSNDIFFYALNASDGTKLWRFKLIDYDKYSGIYSSPAYWNGAVFIAGKNGLMYSFDAKGGGKNWSRKLFSSVYSTPSVKDGIIYIASYERKLYALNTKNGKILWTRDLAGETPYASPSLGKDRVYVGLKNGVIKVFDRTNGGERGEVRFPSAVDSTPVVLSDKALLVGCNDSTLNIVDLNTGSVVWKFKTDGPIHASPAVSESAVYAASQDGSVYAFAP